MARRKKYADFRNFDKTYNRYVRDYYRKARQLYKHRMGLSPKSRLPKSVTKEQLQKEMLGDKYDPLTGVGGNPLSRANFADTYRAVKRDLKKEESSADPIQYIVNDQAYEYSRKQYLGYKRATEELNLDLPKIDFQDFMLGKWKSEEYFKIVKEQYHEIKEYLESQGYSGKDLTLEIQSQIGSLYFGSE